MPHQINLKVTTGDTVYFLRDNKIQSGSINRINIELVHIPGDWNRKAECKIITDVYITIDPIHLKNSKSIPDSGFSRRMDQVFLTKEELVQDLVK